MAMQSYGVFLVFFNGAGFKSSTRVEALDRGHAHAIVARYSSCVAVTHSIEIKPGGVR